MIHIRFYNKQFLNDDLDHEDVHKQNELIQIIEQIVHCFYKDVIILLIYIDLNHVIYKQNIVDHYKRFH
jgi:hypothetical protein